MLRTVLLFMTVWEACTSISDVYYPHNVTRSTLAGIAAYRSALTLDWLAAEDSRQRELALAFETEASLPEKVLASDCISYSKPASGKVARLMLELLKNLEGDDATLIPALIQTLIRSKLLVETSLLEAEPDLDALVKTPDVMMGEPHATFPKILAMTWMAATDPPTVKKHGWCPISKVTKYLTVTRPMVIAKTMRSLDPVIARVRFIMEDFIQHVTPNMYDKKALDFIRTTSVNYFRKNSQIPVRTDPTKQVTATRTPPPHNNLKSAKVTADRETFCKNQTTKSSDTHIIFRDQREHTNPAGGKRVPAFLLVLAIVPW